MSANVTLNDYIALELKKAEDNNVVKSITHAIKKEYENCYPNEKTEEKPEDIAKDYAKILNMTNLSLKMFANSHYKLSPSLESSDIEQIKKSLNNYANKHETIVALKKELINDLTEFQTQIKTKHIQKIASLKEQKQLCEKQAQIYDFQKNKLIMDRLSKIVWPYDAKTKEYDSKIATLQSQINQCTQKILDLQQKRPMANEKDILLYQMYLKEKYANK